MNWVKAGKPKSPPSIGRKGKPGQHKQPAGQPQKAPPSWLSNKWNKAKVVGGAAMTFGTGVALGSMIPFAASKDTETDIDRMNSSRSKGVRRQE